MHTFFKKSFLIIFFATLIVNAQTSIDSTYIYTEKKQFDKAQNFAYKWNDYKSLIVCGYKLMGSFELKESLDYFNKALKSEDSNGKKLGFITQELGREINTIGSKSNFAPMQKLVVQMKDELEKIKEQNLNVL